MIAGTIYMYAGSVAPSGFLMCDGSVVSRTDYADLFAAIGTTYGSGDGSTTFGLPDLSGRIPIGVSSTHALASTGGEENHTLLSNELPEHLHEVPQHGHASTIKATTPSLSHSITQPAYNYNKPNSTRTIYTGSSGTAYSGTSSVAATRTNLSITDHPASDCTVTGGILDCSSFDSSSAGGGSSHNNLQPYLTMSYIIATGE